MAGNRAAMRPPFDYPRGLDLNQLIRDTLAAEPLPA
jgi:hypothetical protein